MPKLPGTRVLLLETQLDSSLASLRSQVRFMREFFQVLPDVELICKEIHSVVDLRKFLTLARRDRRIRIIHIIAHGEAPEGDSKLVLTNDEILDLTDRNNIRIFKDLNVDVLFLSACKIGVNSELMRRLARTAGVRAVFSYTDSVGDEQAFIAESLFYNLAFGKFQGRRSTLGWPEVYERLKIALEILGIDKYMLSNPLIVADFPEG